MNPNSPNILNAVLIADDEDNDGIYGIYIGISIISLNISVIDDEI
jgi:hypothetical protein